MLSPGEKRTFDDLVRRLHADDPGFVRRVERTAHPPRYRRALFAVLLWMCVPVCVAVGGWTGLLMAAVAGGYGAWLMATRPREVPADGLGWSSADRRPGAPA